jgi:PadR family transcriptional regulator, regulatory protein PadR
LQGKYFWAQYLVIQDKGRSDSISMSSTQMLKGILEGCLLAIIKEGEVYGYELAEKLGEYGFDSLSEGTIYPLLIRMQKEKLVNTTLKKSTAGPSRKYYSLSEKGESELEVFIDRWDKLSSNVNKIVKNKGGM